MAVKTFGSERLTSPDINNFLANAGLVYIKSQTIGTAVSSVTVSDAFSSTYDNYVITVSGGSAATDSGMALTLGSKSTNYWGQLLYGSWGNTAQAYGSKVFTSFIYCGYAYSGGLYSYVVVSNPYLSKDTEIFSNHLAGGDVGYFTGRTADTTSYTSFTYTSSAALTGGTITVYGYRKA